MIKTIKVDNFLVEIDGRHNDYVSIKHLSNSGHLDLDDRHVRQGVVKALALEIKSLRDSLCKIAEILAEKGYE